MCRSTLPEFRSKIIPLNLRLAWLVDLARRVSGGILAAERSGDQELVDDLLRLKNRLNRLLAHELAGVSR